MKRGVAHDLLPLVRRYVRRHALLARGESVIVGVSGGPDSVALLHLLVRLADTMALRLHVAHLHHGLRGAEADGDAAFVVRLAAELGLPCTVERVDVAALARAHHRTLEEAARHARYTFLTRTAQRVGATVIAVGHNADDQAETVLMHLLRGTGMAGLRGMLPATPLHADTSSLRLIRPLLSVPRAKIEAYCATHHLATRLDRSNLDTVFLRNRIRHEVLPYLQNLAPRLSRRLGNLAQTVQADYDLLQKVTSDVWEELRRETSPRALSFDLAGWRRQHLAIRRALVRRAVQWLSGSLRDLSFDHVEQAVYIAQHGSTGAEAILPHGVHLVVGYTTLLIGCPPLPLPLERPWLPEGTILPVPLPGHLSLENGWTLHVHLLEEWDVTAIEHNPDSLSAWLDVAALTGEVLRLRTRRAGDRFCPQGMGGIAVRLSDFLINAKIPRSWRDHLPLLEGGGKILWIVGVRQSEWGLVSPRTRQVAYLRWAAPS